MFGHISTLIAVQKQMGITIPQRENWLSGLAEDIPQFVWASDGHGRKTFCSHRYLDFTGASDLQAMDRTWTDFIHADDRAATASAWMHSLASGEPYTAEYRLRRNDGVYRYVRAQALPIYDGNGGIDAWLGMSKDVHEERVAERARELEAKLLAVRRLASSVAHEINNPLESVTNAIFLAQQDQGLDEETRYYLRVADAELRRVAHITAHSLRFYQQANAPVRKQLKEIVEDILSVYSSRLTPAGITVERDYRDDAELLCYAEELSQAITNLIRNSIDAVGAGGQLRIRIRAAESWSCEEEPQVRITIADNGVGIPRASRVHLFEPFFSTKGSTHTGLALWVTDQITHKHGGRITFRSATTGSRKGTSFVVVLPTAGVDADCADRTAWVRNEGGMMEPRRKFSKLPSSSISWQRRSE